MTENYVLLEDIFVSLSILHQTHMFKAFKILVINSNCLLLQRFPGHPWQKDKLLDKNIIEGGMEKISLPYINKEC